MWRPNHWTPPTHSIYCIKNGDTDTMWGDCTACVYEAGADAMFLGLFDTARESPTGTFVIDSRGYNAYGELKDE